MGQDPQGHLRVRWFARRTHGPQDSYCTNGYIFVTVKGKRLKSAKQKGAWNDVHEVPGAYLQVNSLSGITWEHICFFQKGCVATWLTSYHTKESTQASMSRIFIGDAGGPHKTGLRVSSLIPWEQKQVWSIDHIVRINSSGHMKTLFLDSIFWGLKAYLPGESQGPVLEKGLSGFQQIRTIG